MAEAVAIYRVYELPWTTAAEQEQRFRRILVRCAAIAFLLSVLLTLLPVPQSDPGETVEIPQRFASLVLERRPPPPPPPAVREEPEPAPLPEPEPEAQPERRVVQEPPPVAAPQSEQPAVVDRTEQARERARSAGLLPFAEQLASLRGSETLARLDRTDLAGPPDGAAPIAQRSLITSRVGAASGGINTAQLSRNTGGAGLAGRSTTQVESPVAGLDAAVGDAASSGVDGSRPARTREEIELVFDSNKGAIYALYNRALRQNPGLEGKLVLRLTIAPDGTVTHCEIVSSELGDPDLEQKLVQRVMLFKFEAKDVEPVTTTKPIDFFPA